MEAEGSDKCKKPERSSIRRGKCNRKVNCSNCPGCNISTESRPSKVKVNNKMSGKKISEGPKKGVKRPSKPQPGGVKRKKIEVKKSTVLKFETKNFCYMCRRESNDNRIADKEKGSQFVKFVTRYLKLNLDETLENDEQKDVFYSCASEEGGQIDIKICRDCLVPVKEFCKSFTAMELARIKMEFHLEQLRNVMKQADRVPSRNMEFRKKVLEGEDAIGLVAQRLLDGFRREFYLKTNLKKAPLVVLDRGDTPVDTVEDRTFLIQSRQSGAPANPVPAPPIRVVHIGKELNLQMKPNTREDQVVNSVKTGPAQLPQPVAGPSKTSTSTPKPANRKVVCVRVQPRAMAVDSNKVPDIVDLCSDDDDESTVSSGDSQNDANGSDVPKATIPLGGERPADIPEENHSIDTDKSPTESEIDTEVDEKSSSTSDLPNDNDSETSSEEGEEQSGDNSCTQDEEIADVAREPDTESKQDEEMADDARERDTEIGDGGCEMGPGPGDNSNCDVDTREVEGGLDAEDAETDAEQGDSNSNSLTGQDDGPENGINQSRVVAVTTIPDYADEYQNDNVHNVDYDLDELLSAYTLPPNYVSVPSPNGNSSPITGSGSPSHLYTIHEEITTTTTMSCTFNNMDPAAIQDFVRGLNLTGNFTINVNQNQEEGEPQPTVTVNEDDNDYISPAAPHHHGVEIMELSD